jgi:hypothetical protein
MRVPLLRLVALEWVYTECMEKDPRDKSESRTVFETKNVRFPLHRIPTFIVHGSAVPGLPDGFFRTKNPNLGNFLTALDWKMFILWPFGIFGRHFGYFVTIWYIFSGLWYHAPRKIWQPCFWGRLNKFIICLGQRKGEEFSKRYILFYWTCRRHQSDFIFSNVCPFVESAEIFF